MFAQQRDEGTIRAPHNIFNRGGGDLGDGLLLLNVVEHNRGWRSEDKAGCPAIEYVIGSDWGLDAFHD